MSMESLGGRMVSGQPVAVYCGGRTHVFAIAAGGAMNHWTSNGAEWSGPSTLPGDSRFGPNVLAPSFPCAIAFPDGTAHVFAIANGGHLARWRSDDGGASWGQVQFDRRAPIPGGGNGLAVASSLGGPLRGERIDVFAVTTFGIIHYSFNAAGQPLAPNPPLPNSTRLYPCVLAAVSSGPGKFDVFAVDGILGTPQHWHFNGAAWSKQMLAGPALHINSKNGFAAVSPELGRIELFAITSDQRMTNWSIKDATNFFKQLNGGPALPDGVPVVVATPGPTFASSHLDVFAIGLAGNAFTGGPLVHWRFDGTWSEAKVYQANLAAGGVGAALSSATAMIDAFAFNSGTDNSLQHWPVGIRGSTRDTWKNWARNRETNPEGHCYPTCLEELVAIVRTAAQQNKRVRAVGSSWSFSDIAVTPGYVVETNKLDKVILDTVVPNALLAPHATSTPPQHLVHVEAGIQLEKLMEFLDQTNRAPYTMGGASGQTLAGVISTSVHGSHFRLPPFPDWVRAIHLIGPDGMQHWIEPKDRQITDKLKLQMALGPDVRVHYDDDWFDSALVTVGSLGIIYSVVLQVREEYKLQETRTERRWLELKKQLQDPSVFAADVDCVAIAIDPGSMGGDDPLCILAERVAVPFSTPSTGKPTFDPLGAFCEGDLLLELLFEAAKAIGKESVVIPALLVALPAVPAVLALTLLFPPALAALTLLLTAAAGAAATVAAATSILYPLLRAAGPGAIGDVVGVVLDQHPELVGGLSSLVTTQFQGPTPPGGVVDIAHNVMGPKNKGECATRGLGLEIAFDANGSHISFIDAALAMLKDEAAMGHVLGGRFSIRFVGKSRAILSPQRTTMTCMVEAVGLRTLSSTKVLLSRLESLGRAHGGIQHWGMFEELTYEDVARGYPRLDTWLRVRNQLTNNGALQTFDNEFMGRCGLIPTAKPKILLRNSADGAIYAIYGGAKFHVPNMDTLNRLFAGVPLRPAQDGELEHIGSIPGDGTLLHEDTTGKVYVIFGGAKFHVPNWDTLTRLFPGFLLRPLWGGALDPILDRPADGTLLREENGTIWIIYGGAKFKVPDPDKELPAFARNSPAMVNNFFGRHISSRGPLRQLWDGALAGIPLIPADGTFFREASNTQYYVIAGGRKEAPRKRQLGEPPRIIHVLWDGALAQIQWGGGRGSTTRSPRTGRRPWPPQRSTRTAPPPRPSTATAAASTGAATPRPAAVGMTPPITPTPIGSKSPSTVRRR